VRKRDISHFRIKKVTSQVAQHCDLKGEPRGPKGDTEREPMQTHGGTTQEGRTHGKRGITQEEVSLGIVRGRGYKIERSPLILDHSVMCILS